PTMVDNDANCAAWAEWRFGAAQYESDLVCITLGTGIGGGLVFDGRVHRGRSGIAGEFGHMQMVPGGHVCECGNRGCWEQYASANARVREARRLLAEDPESAATIRAAAGGDAGKITGVLVSGCAVGGDPASLRLLRDMGDWLGVGLANLGAALDPG